MLLLTGFDLTPTGSEMQAMMGHRLHPELRELVVEASLALARLDPDRLEELALSCRALNRDLAVVTDEERTAFHRQARAASREMAVFERVLDATRANLAIMSRVRDRRGRHLEYNPPFVTGSDLWGKSERKDGHN